MQDSAPPYLSTPDMMANPYPMYRELRSRSPFPFTLVLAESIPGADKPLMSWALLKHADVSAVLRAPDTFSSRVEPIFAVVPYMPLLHDDAPRHHRLRKFVSSAFTPKRMVELEPWIAEITRTLLDDLRSGPAEVMSGLCVPLPVSVIAALLGVSKEHHGRFRDWGDAVAGYASSIPREERAARLQELFAYLAQAIAERRREGGRDDLISALVEAEVDGQRLSDEDIIRFTMLLLVAGNDTTTALLGNMLNLLAHRPELWQRAREDRSLVDPIIEEVMRYESPVQRMGRLTTRDTELSGVKIPAGHLVEVFFGAANRDPDHFEAPDEFRLGRPATEQFAFGVGTHHCIGALLARAEGRIALNQLLDRFETLSPGAEPPERQRVVTTTYAYLRLPLVLGAGQRGA